MEAARTLNKSHHTPAPRSDLGEKASHEISSALAALLADAFALYIKTKNFHWHVSGPHFRDYHLLFDTHADEIFAITDQLAERGRKLGGQTIRSISEIARKQRIFDNDAAYVEPNDMLAELESDNRQLVAEMRNVHQLCDEYRDIATAGMLEAWVDEGERRIWFLYESRRSNAAG